MVGCPSMKKKIMFVDDEPDQLFSFEQVLNELGDDFEFIGVKSGEECFKELEQGGLPDLIFLDIIIPGMSGCEVYDTIRGTPVWKDIPIVFLTGNNEMVDKITRGCCGDAVLEKPVETKDLFDCIKQVMK